jgi:hypothetical protein
MGLWDYCVWDYGAMAWWNYTLVKTKEIAGFQDDNDLNEGCDYDMM